MIFHDLRMTQFWSVKYICLVSKLKFLLWTLFEILGNIYDRPVAIVFETVVFETVFLVLFGDDGNLFFDEKILESLF